MSSSKQSNLDNILGTIIDNLDLKLSMVIGSFFNLRIKRYLDADNKCPICNNYLKILKMNDPSLAFENLAAEFVGECPRVYDEKSETEHYYKVEIDEGSTYKYCTFTLKNRKLYIEIYRNYTLISCAGFSDRLDRQISNKEILKYIKMFKDGIVWW